METHQETLSKDVLDVTEKGAPRGGSPQVTNRRLYLQLQVYGNCKNPEAAVKALRSSGLESVLYSIKE